MKLSLLPCLTWLVLAATQSPAQEFLGVEGVSDDCHNACNALIQTQGANTFYKSGSPPDFATAFFSNQQRETIPACVVRPSNAEEVSSLLKTLFQYSCHFAIKSGGHAMFKGASNSNGGITIDLAKINGIEVSQDRGTTKVGTGARWGKVYEVIEPQGLTVVGGRDANVGVGGFLLGGGISFLSRRYGWAMDNVLNYEIVLANGSITSANPKTNKDLFWALRGGGGNFGIVTHFDLETYPQTDVWGGNMFFMISDLSSRREALGITRPFSPSLFWVTQTLGRSVRKLICLLGYCNEYETFVQATEHVAAERRGADPYSQLYMSVGCLPKYDICLGTAFLTHSNAEVDPPSFADIKALKPVFNSNRVTNITTLVKEITSWNDPGFRQLWGAITLKADAKLLSKIFDIFLEETEAVNQVPGILPSFVMQPISQIAIAGNTKNGGNALGITEEDSPLLMLSISPRWSNAEDDETVHAAFGKFLNRSEALSKEMGLFHPYIYQNYANGSQDVFAGYGEKNRKRLRETQQKYDVGGLFSRLSKGYFKV